MAQTGYTPISLYYTTTASAAPTAGNLVAGELALNNNDGKLFYKDSSGVVQTIATKATAALPTTTTGSGSIVLQTSPTITTPTINSITSAAATALTLQSAGTTAVTIDTSQNVGIGTASPSAKLSIFGATENQIRITDDAAYYYAIGRSSTQGFLTFYGSQAAATGYIFTGAAGERMRIDSSGNLLINTTSLNSGKVNIVASGSAQPCMIWNDSDATSASQGIVSIRRNGTAVGLISTTNAITTYASLSDYRLKENIAPMTGALATVSALKPVTYKWKSTGEESQGFIAHELQAVVSDCVTGEKDAVDAEGKPVYQGIDTSFLVATLTASIQELHEMVKAQALEIAQLKGN